MNVKKKKESKQTPFLLILVTGVHQSTEKIENLNPQNNEKPVAINFMQFIRKEYCSRKRYKRYSDAYPVICVLSIDFMYKPP